jgi:hypothetical protein
MMSVGLECSVNAYRCLVDLGLVAPRPHTSFLPLLIYLPLPTFTLAERMRWRSERSFFWEVR